MVASSGIEALAKARGVQVSELPTDLVNDAKLVTAESKSTLGIIKDALGSVQTAFNSAQSTIAEVNSTVGQASNLVNTTRNTAATVTSPLSNLMNRNA